MPYTWWSSFDRYSICNAKVTKGTIFLLSLSLSTFHRPDVGLEVPCYRWTHNFSVSNHLVTNLRIQRKHTGKGEVISRCAFNNMIAFLELLLYTLNHKTGSILFQIKILAVKSIIHSFVTSSN